MPTDDHTDVRDHTADSRESSTEWTSKPVLAHVLPFAAWLLLMLLLGYIGPEGAWRYAVRTGACVLLMLWARPWRWYTAPRRENLVAAVAVGVLTFVVWVLPEIRFADPVPLIQELYLRFGILPLGRITPPVETSIYAPETCGWWLTAIRIAGSAFVIAVIEEFFWRGFLYRRLIQTDFLELSPGTFDKEAFLFMCVLFGLEHQRLLAGVVAGALYGYLYIKTRDIWAPIIAHVLTNLLLGIFVVATRHYAFW